MSGVDLRTGVDRLLGRIEVGRRQRRIWVGHRRAHIEVRGAHEARFAGLARGVERALEALEAVHWAEVNAVTGRVVVAFDPDGIGVDDLVDVVEGVEEAYGAHQERFPVDRPEHPGDAEPLRRHLVALGADTVGLGVSLWSRALRLVPLPAEFAGLVSVAEHVPRVHRLIERRLGAPASDLVLGLSSAVTNALSQGPVGLLASIAHRAELAAEVRSRHQVWARREPELAGRRHPTSLDAVAPSRRPRALPPGPLETYADRASLASLGAFAVTLAATRSPRRAASALVAGVPKAGSLGRDTFAARLGRLLANRNVLVLDAAVLRRLDRIDTVVLDAALVRTGRLEIDTVEAVAGHDHDDVARHAWELVDPGHPQQVHRARHWRAGPLEALGVPLPRGVASRARQLARGRRTVLGVARRDELAGLVVLSEVLDSRAQAVVASAARLGHLTVVAGSRGQVAQRLGAARTVPAGRAMAGAIRALQAEGRAVLLVSGAHAQGALRAADCAVGIPGAQGHPPWAAHLVASSGWDDAWLVVEATGVARSVSSRGAALSLAGSGTAALWAVTGRAARAGRRASLPVNGAALAAQGMAAAALSGLGRRRPPPPPPPPWHAMSGDAVLDATGSRRSGLTPAEAGERLGRAPVAAAPSAALAAVARAVGSELVNPLTPVLGLGAAMAAAVGSMSDAALVGGVVVANALVAGAQRVRTERSLQRLLHLDHHTVTARRGGARLELPSRQLVRGDVVELRGGDVVPADCRVLDVRACEVDESAVTGESLPVAKQAAATPGAPVPDRSCMLFEGTTIVTGEVLAVVVATGADTEAGRALAGAPQAPPSGVEARLARLTAVTVPATVASGAAVAGWSFLRGRSARQAVGTGVSLAVAAVPEGLPLLATTAQLAAARRLASRQALVRNPRTIEALGRVDVLCFDKTGTLTAGQITLRRVSDGMVDEPVDRLGPALRSVLATAMRASPEAESEDEVLLHATDRAVVEGALQAGVTPGDGLGGWRQVAELAFEPARGFHAVVGISPDGARVAVKGAPEVVLPRCDTWRSPTGVRPMDRRARRHLDAVVERLGAQGLRVLAVAERASSERAELGEDRVRHMELVGFLGLADHVRPTAAAAVSELRRAGVDVVMVTGDHRSTAEAIADELGIVNGKQVVTGVELDGLSDAELVRLVPHVSVFARVTPAHKVRIVEAYQRAGRVVAMTGDGANDAAAIRLAHAGIALGRHGAPAARLAADLVVTDDRIETIVDAIVEGRAMWASVRDALAVLVGGNLGEVAFTMGTALLTGASPLGARQLLLVNLLTDMVPALAIALRSPVQRTPEALLHEGPDASLGDALVRQIVLRALATAGGAGGAWLAARATGRARRAQTVALAALVGSQLGQTALVGLRSPLVLGSTALSAAALVAVVQVPGVSHFFGCTPLGPVGWGIAAGAATGATTVAAVAPVITRLVGARSQAVTPVAR